MSSSTSEEHLLFVSPDEIRVQGHRIWLEHIVPYFQLGMTDEEIVTTFPTLRLDEVAGVRAWYDARRAEADDYVARSGAALAAEYERYLQQPHAPVMARVRRRYETLRASGRQRGLREAQAAAESSDA
jgi:uncharacterized protein (DUF433 family)